MDVFESSSGNAVANSSIAPSVEPFLGSFPASSILAAGSRTASTSSSRKSSYEEAGQHERRSAVAASFHPPPAHLSRSAGRQQNESPPTCNNVSRPTVVEWKPEETHSDVEVSLPSTPRDEGEGQSGASEIDQGKEEEEEELPSAVSVVDNCSPKEEEETYMSGVFNSTVTVTIDPPRDNGQGSDQDDPVYRYLEGGTSIASTTLGDGRTGHVTSESRVVGECGEGEGQQSEEGNEGMWGGFSESMEEGEEGEDLFDDLNDVDSSEEEDSDTSPPVRLCLLSR